MTRFLLCLAATVVGSQSAYAAIYKWIDESGRTVYSNQPPANAKLARRAKVVVPDEPVSKAAAGAPREQELLERISRLERELAAQQYTPPVQYAPPAQYVPPPDYGYGYGMPYYYPPVYPATVIVRPIVRPAARFAVHPVRSFPARTFHRFRR